MAKGKLAARLTCVGIIYVLMAALTAASSAAQPANEPRFVPGRVLVIPKQDKRADTEKVHRAKGRRVLKKIESARLEVVELAPGENVADAIAEYKATGAVELAEPDYLMKASELPDDPFFYAQWGLHNTAQSGGGAADADMDAPEAWDSVRNDGNEVIVAIIDSGARLTHEDLAPNLWTNPNEIPGNGRDDDMNGYIDDVHGIDATSGSGNPTDVHGHGTHVAGIIGAAANNGAGIAGIARNVKLMPLRFMDPDGYGASSDAVEAIDYARRHGAKVMNASYGSPGPSGSMQRAIQTARLDGIVFVAAAGNYNSNNDVVMNYPSNFAVDNIVAVASTTSRDLRSSFSNYGALTVDVAAPGTMIFSCGHAADNEYVYMSGTSMATPYVAGIAAMIRAQHPNWTAAQIVQHLIGTVDPLPDLQGITVSGGRVNMAKALAPEPPVQLKAAGLNDAGQFHLELPEAAGLAYVLEVSTDLQNWTEASVGIVPAGGVVNFNEDLVAEGGRFFRAKVLK